MIYRKGRCWDTAPFHACVRIPTKPATHSNRKPATDSDLMSATWRLLPRIYAMMFCPEPLVKRGLDLGLRKRSGGGG